MKLCPISAAVAWMTLPVAVSLPGEPPAARHGFVDVTVETGIAYNQFASSHSQLGEAYFTSGGVAVVDYNQDGWMDLFVTRMDGPCILYENRYGKFHSISAEELGIGIASGANGAVWGDVDNDGDQDLYISTIGVGRNFFYLNDGAGQFKEQAMERGVDVSNLYPVTPGAVFYYGGAFGDYDRDGFLDLFTTSWNDVAVGTGPHPHGGGIGTRLLKNVGTTQPGFFQDVTEEAGVAMNNIPGWAFFFQATFALAPQFSDLDGDGHPDLAVAADFGTSALFWNKGDGTFFNGRRSAHVGTDENGMGSVLADLDGDGRLDWFVTSIYDDQPIPVGAMWRGTGNRFYRNAGNREFVDATDEAGVRDGGWGWGAIAIDCDNDTDLDLLMANGINFPPIAYDRFRNQQTRLWLNNGEGVFELAGEDWGVSDRKQGRGVVWLDFDNDGDQDVFIVNNSDRPVLYRNELENGFRWLKIKLQGTLSNRDGTGARVELRSHSEARVCVSELQGGAAYLGQNPRRLHFGLGPGVDQVESVVIHWPSGEVQTIENAPVNVTLVVVEGQGFTAIDESIPFDLRIQSVQNGQVNFMVRAQPGKSVILESSLNLKKWMELKDFQMPQEGRLQISQEAPVASKHCFYRVRQL